MRVPEREPGTREREWWRRCIEAGRQAGMRERTAAAGVAVRPCLLWLLGIVEQRAMQTTGGNCTW